MKKNSVFKQAFSIFTVHSVACLFTFLVMMPIIGAVASNNILSVCLSILMALVYGVLLFNSSYESAASDHKPYSRLKPYPLKGFVISIGAIVPVVLSWIFYVICWEIAPIPQAVVSGTEIPLATFWANMIYSFFTAPFWNVINIQGKEASLAGQIISIAVPALACFIGYYLGYIKLDYTKYINKIIYDKNNK